MPKKETLVLIGKEREKHDFGPGTPPDPTKLGAQQAFTDDIVSVDGVALTPNGQHSGFCMLVGTPNFWLCQAGFSLPGIPDELFASAESGPQKSPFPNGGQFQVRGLLNFDGNAPFTTTILGGIDDYRGAEGRVDTSFPGPKGTTKFAVSIETHP